MYTKFELPNKKIKTMGKKGRKKSVNPKKNQKKKGESRFFKSLLPQNAKIADANLRTLLR
jgi:hypothetical protein